MTGTDANVIQLMHTPNEIMSLDDIENTVQLIAGFCERVTAEIDWTPA